MVISLCFTSKEVLDCVVFEMKFNYVSQQMLSLASFAALATPIFALSPDNAAWAGDQIAAVASHPSNDESLSAVFNNRFLLTDKPTARLAKVITVVDVKAPAKTVLEILSDFSKFPEFMKRVKTVAVTRQEGNLFFTESYLKPQMFVSQSCNHTITLLSGKPNTIEWVLIDGNFPSASGRWQIESGPSDKSCKVTYTVAIDPGPLIPANLASIGLRVVQKEVVIGMKNRAEQVARQSALSKQINTEGPGFAHSGHSMSGAASHQI